MRHIKTLLLFIVIGLLAISFLFFARQNNQEIIVTDEKGNTYNLLTLEKEYIPIEWEFDGDSVFVNDSRVFISATPHTAIGWVNFVVIPKTYSGEIDLVMGFNTSQIKPTQAETNPHYENVTHSYTCAEENYFNYTINPNHFWCWANNSYVDNSTQELIEVFNLIFEHDFDSGNLEERIAYWTDNEIVWNDVAGAFETFNFDFQGVSKWYFRKNINVVAGETYYFRVYLQPQSLNSGSKYWFATKPSSETLMEAIDNDHLYALDPWTDDLSVDLDLYFDFEDYDESISHVNNLSDNEGTMNFTTTGALIGKSGRFTTGNNLVLAETSLSNIRANEGTLNFWFYVDDREGASDRLFGNSDNEDKNIDVHSAGYLYELGFVDGGAHTGQDIEDGKWVMITEMHNSTGAFIYVNASLIHSGAIDTDQDDESLNIGATAGETLDLNGYMDEMSWWSRPLSYAEIEIIWNSGSGLTYVPPLKYADITLNSPEIMFNSSSPTINFNGTVSDGTALVNVSLWINWTLNQTNSSGINNSNYLFSTILTDGFYNWSYEACNGDGNCINTTRNFTIDTIPPIVNDAENLTDLIAYSLPINSTWNFTATDLHINHCYYNTSDDATINVITCNASEIIEWASEGNKTIQYFANDTFGWETSKVAYIYIYSIGYNQSEDLDPVGEGTNVTFTLNLSMIDMPTSTANLFLNDTYYLITGVASTNYTIFTTSIVIPEGYGNTTGFPQLWLWNYTIEGIVSNINTSDTNITVYEIAVDNCTDYNEVILNLTLKDEESNVEVNESLGSNIEVDLLISSKINASLIWTYNHTWVNESNVAVCIPLNILNNSEYQIDFDLGWDSTGRVWEFYFLDSGTLNSTKIFDAQTTYEIDLMDLLTADSTSFLFNYFDVDGLPVDNSIAHVFRKYIGEGLFREVERSQADENGDTIMHLVEEDVIYYFLITQYGIPLYTSSTYSALCQETPCTIQLEAGGDSASFSTDWDLIDGGAYDISSDADTRVVSLNYTLNEISTMNLTIYRYDNDGDVSVITSNQSTDTSDFLILSVPQGAGNVSFFASLYQNGTFVNSEWVNFESTPRDRFGVTLALFLGVLIILTLGLMAVTEGVGTLVMVILGVAISGFLGLITTSLSTGVNIVVYLIVAGGILLWKLTGGRK